MIESDSRSSAVRVRVRRPPSRVRRGVCALFVDRSSCGSPEQNLRLSGLSALDKIVEYAPSERIGRLFRRSPCFHGHNPEPAAAAAGPAGGAMHHNALILLCTWQSAGGRRRRKDKTGCQVGQ